MLRLMTDRLCVLCGGIDGHNYASVHHLGVHRQLDGHGRSIRGRHGVVVIVWLWRLWRNRRAIRLHNGLGVSLAYLIARGQRQRAS
jgi:hypothetical protein